MPLRQSLDLYSAYYEDIIILTPMIFLWNLSANSIGLEVILLKKSNGLERFLQLYISTLAQFAPQKTK